MEEASKDKTVKSNIAEDSALSSSRRRVVTTRLSYRRHSFPQGPEIKDVAALERRVPNTPLVKSQKSILNAVYEDISPPQIKSTAVRQNIVGAPAGVPAGVPAGAPPGAPAGASPAPTKRKPTSLSYRRHSFPRDREVKLFDEAGRDITPDAWKVPNAPPAKSQKSTINVAFEEIASQLSYSSRYTFGSRLTRQVELRGTKIRPAERRQAMYEQAKQELGKPRQIKREPVIHKLTEKRDIELGKIEQRAGTSVQVKHEPVGLIQLKNHGLANIPQRSESQLISRVFQCGKGCYRLVFETWKDLYIHYHVTHYQCVFCFEPAFKDKSTLDVHLVTEHMTADQHAYTCKYCIEMFDNQGDLGKHRWFHLPQRPYYCHKCQRHFHKQVMEHYHEDECLNNYKSKMLKQFKCRTCFESLKGFNHYYEHCVDNHNRYWCVVCVDLRISFSTAVEIRNHMGTHFLCRYCVIRWFSSRELRDEHIRDDHPGPPFECPLCAQAFHNLWDLEIHHRSNHREFFGSFNIFCRFCSYDSTDPNDLQSHLLGECHKRSIAIIAAGGVPA